MSEKLSTSSEQDKSSVDKPTVNLTDSEATTFQEMTAGLNIDSQPDNRGEVSAADFQPHSLLADMVRNGAERVAGFLENRAATKDERQEARTEKKEKGKEFVKNTGGKALRAAKATGMVTLGITYLAMEASKDGIKMVTSKVVLFGKQAALNFQARRQRRLQAKRTAKMDKVHEEANYDNKIFDAQTEATNLHKNFDEHREAESMNNHYREHTEAIEMNEQYDKDKRYGEEAEAEQMDKDFDKARREQRIKAEVARRQKAYRKAKRQEMYGKVREKGSELWDKVSSNSKRYGRAALKAFRFLKRGVKAVAKGTAAGVKAFAATTSAGMK